MCLRTRFRTALPSAGRFFRYLLYLSHNGLDLLLGLRDALKENNVQIPSDIMVLCICGTVSATQLQDATLVSPIMNRPFPVQRTHTYKQFGTDQPADMGVDDDTCRHHSGISEYDMYIATCPYTLFSALSVEWMIEAAF